MTRDDLERLRNLILATGCDPDKLVADRRWVRLFLWWASGKTSDALIREMLIQEASINTEIWLINAP
jgi:hypothetical protein